jgi:hypothetical protein
LEANNEQLEQMARDLEAEKGKTDSLLREILPSSVATCSPNKKQIKIIPSSILSIDQRMHRRCPFVNFEHFYSSIFIKNPPTKYKN